MTASRDEIGGKRNGGDDAAAARDELLKEIDVSIEKYRHRRKRNAIIQWAVLIPITIAGFFTASAGVTDASGVVDAWYSSPSALIFWGIVTAVGSVIIQTANPAQKAERFEKKKDALRAIKTAMKFRDLEVSLAAELVELARSDPSVAFENLFQRKGAN
jgi:hypothetical protein